MAEHVYIKDIGAHAGKEAEIRGWLYNKRSSGKLHFLQVRDGSGIIQCVMFKGDVPEEMFKLADAATQESSVIVSGAVREDKRSSLGFELGVKDFRVVQMAKDYPISPKDHGTGFLMENRHLWLRSSRQHAALNVRAEIVSAVRDYFNSNGFLLVDAPVFTPAACEGTSTLFETEYFGEKAYLTQSGQLYMEAAAMAFGKVYCFGPTFRAEKSKTRRHLTEFWMVEPEMAYCDIYKDMDVAEDFVAYIVARVLKNKTAELKALERDTSKLEKAVKPFPRITYAEAIDLLAKDKPEGAKWGDDFGGDEETIISSRYDRPVIVHHYPAEIKAFYMKNDPQQPETAMCMDMLAPEGYGEIIGGGQREDDHDTLVEKIKKHNLPPEAFDWYLDLRKYGSVPHAGFGLGIERTVAWICGLPHVRETIPFPRLMDRIKP
ncbi:MAG: asparagine--tRNA ligase [Elusimicrobiales bacterium]